MLISEIKQLWQLKGAKLEKILVEVRMTIYKITL